jgi:hypothetical protein
MRITEVNGAIADAVRLLRTIRLSPEVISWIVGRMNYGKAPEHAKQYVQGYADGLQDRPDEPLPPAF